MGELPRNLVAGFIFKSWGTPSACFLQGLRQLAVPSRPRPRPLVLVFLAMAVLTGAGRDLATVPICISPVVLGIFSCPCWPAVCLLLRTSVSSPALDQVTCFLAACLLASDFGHQPLIVRVVREYFLHCTGDLFELLIAFSAVQKLFILIQPCSLMFVFVACALGVMSKK